MWSAPAFAGDVQWNDHIRSYFQRHCLACHGEDQAESDFRIDKLSPRVGFEDTPQWLEIMQRISAGEMPPPDHADQPTAERSAEIVGWLSERLKEGESARLAARGRVSYNRLTRDEYVHTIGDLLGVRFNATDPGGFLEDPEWHGFERIGSVLTLSPANIEKYLTAAETVLAEAYPGEDVPLFEGEKRALLENQINERHRERLRELGLLDKVRFEMWPGDIFRYTALRDPLPTSGVYEISFTLSGLKPQRGRAPRLKVYEQQLDRVLHEQDVVAAEDDPITVTFRAHLPKGRPSILVYNDVPGPSILPRSGRHGNGVPFLSIQDGRLPWQLKLTDEQGRPRYPLLIIDSISWRGPIVTDRERELRAAFMPQREDDVDELCAALARLAQRAFRRPVADKELAPYVEMVRQELEAGEPFREAVKAGMAAILCSKSFLFITEGDHDKHREELNDWEIASRMSYLLWSTMPDDELLQSAQRGELKDKQVRRRQARRMLADPRAGRFADSFAAQWLRLRKVGMFAPDRMLFPEYDERLEASMIGEAKAFFAEVLAENLTIREFLDSDWTMLNTVMAEYYGLPADALDGDEFRRAALPDDGRRGGVLTQAAILSLTSDGTRHRPVHRGVWISESIFGKSPPPPPANVDPIEPNPVDAPKATLRMKLEAHVHDPRCAACHAQIDPLGLALENYDAIGRWRTVEVTEGSGKNPPVDPSGQLPDGREYETPKQFKQLLLDDIDKFNAAFIEKLAIYALRRTMTFDDAARLAEIAEASRDADYRLRDLVEELIASDLFVHR